MRLVSSFVLLAIIFGTACNKKVKSDVLDGPRELELVNQFGFVNAISLAEVVDYAKIQKKLVFLDIYTDWCLPCKMMDEDVFTDRRLGEFFSEHFVSYKVDAESEGGSELAELFEVPSYPTLLFLDERGRVLVKKIGMAYHDEMYKLADEAIAKVKVAETPVPE